MPLKRMSNIIAVRLVPMDILKIKAAKCQIATAVKLFYSCQ
jgi:hypothetical protein